MSAKSDIANTTSIKVKPRGAMKAASRPAIVRDRAPSLSHGSPFRARRNVFSSTRRSLPTVSHGHFDSDFFELPVAAPRLSEVAYRAAFESASASGWPAPAGRSPSRRQSRARQQLVHHPRALGDRFVCTLLRAASRKPRENICSKVTTPRPTMVIATRTSSKVKPSALPRPVKAFTTDSPRLTSILPVSGSRRIE